MDPGYAFKRCQGTAWLHPLIKGGGVRSLFLVFIEGVPRAYTVKPRTDRGEDRAKHINTKNKDLTPKYENQHPRDREAFVEVSADLREREEALRLLLVVEEAIFREIERIDSLLDAQSGLILTPDDLRLP